MRESCRRPESPLRRPLRGGPIVMMVFWSAKPAFRPECRSRPAVSSAGGAENLVMAVIRGRYNERGDFLFSSTPLIPDSPTPVDAELIIPHIVDGGGYTTSFIFMNNSSDPANVVLRTVAPSGQPLKLT